MPDPYAQRTRTLTGQGPSGSPPWTDAVQERDGILTRSVAELAAAGIAEAEFVAVLCRGAGLLPAVVRLKPVQAAALALLHADREAVAVAADASNALDALSGSEPDLYAIKHGWVAGPRERAGAVAVSAELVAVVLDAAREGSIVWELDPDFGYEVAAEVPGLGSEAALALCPRLLYTRLGRVYEHAELVALIKRERRDQLESIEGLDSEILGALES